MKKILQELTTIALQNNETAGELPQPQTGWVKLENFNQVSITATVYGRRTFTQTTTKPVCSLFIENSATGQAGTWSNVLDMGGTDKECPNGEHSVVFKFGAPDGTLVGPWFRWRVAGNTTGPGEITFRVILVGESTECRC